MATTEVEGETPLIVEMKAQGEIEEQEVLEREEKEEEFALWWYRNPPKTTTDIALAACDAQSS